MVKSFVSDDPNDRSSKPVVVIEQEQRSLRKCVRLPMHVENAGVIWHLLLIVPVNFISWRVWILHLVLFIIFLG
jgi:hypothetical protein